MLLLDVKQTVQDSKGLKVSGIYGRKEPLISRRKTLIDFRQFVEPTNSMQYTKMIFTYMN